VGKDRQVNRYSPTFPQGARYFAGSAAGRHYVVNQQYGSPG
jgi:hypothetical protein